MKVDRLQPRLIDYPRYLRWVGASHALNGMFPALVPVIQGIGCVDAELCAEDVAYFERRERAAEKSPGELPRFCDRDSDSLTYRINLSSLWLVGAYEVARTLDQALSRRQLL